MYIKKLLQKKFLKNYSLKIEYINPQAEHSNTIIWLHGLGDSSKGFYDFFKFYAPKETKIVLPKYFFLF
jgi:predicted esterase